MSNKDIYKQIRELKKEEWKVKDIRKRLGGISKNKYYELLPKAYESEIDKLNKDGLSDKEIAQKLNIKETIVERAMKHNILSNKVNVSSTTILRSDPQYKRIEKYRDFELYRGITIEAITRINQSEEIFQIKDLSSSINLTQRHMLSMIEIDKEYENITSYVGILNAISKKLSKKDNTQAIKVQKVRDSIFRDLEKLNAKINNNFYLESNQEIMDIQYLQDTINEKDINSEIDSIANSISDNIQIIHAKIKEKENQKKNKLQKDNQIIHTTMMDEYQRIKEQVKNPSEGITEDVLKGLKNNLWAMRKTIHLFKTKKTLIDQILMKNSMEYDSLMFGNNYCYQHEKDFIDILIEEIDIRWEADNGNRKKKLSKNKRKGRNIKLVKHYLLKYIQKPVLEYGINYSNTLLDEYNFEKVFLEIDMMIPEEEQKKMLEEMLKELYSKEIPYSYSDILIQSLLKDIKDENFMKVYIGRKGERHTSLSERVADMFYIYDTRSHMSSMNCADNLAHFYQDRVSSVAENSVKQLHASISKFMKEFEEKYKIQPSSLQRRALQ